MSKIRFGVWAPVHGNRAAAQDPLEPYDASWAHNRDTVLEAEALGYDSTLVAQHTANPHFAERDQLEAWTSAAALAPVTSRIEIIAAIKPALYHPVVLAKMALQIEEISGGRFAINLVNAWNRAEFEKAGIPFLDHDERYAYGREWLSIVERLTRGETVEHHGKHFSIDGYKLSPAGRLRPRPGIYLGGESEPARELAVDHSDVWFINGQAPEAVAALISDVKARPRQGDALRFGLAAFVIARETEAEAQAEHRRLIALAEQDKPAKEIQKANTDPKVVMFQTMAKQAFVGTNGGTAAGLVGSYDQVAERIDAFHRSGVELFMLQFQPLRSEMRRFAEQIFPRLGHSIGSIAPLYSEAR
ncbi:LLM class flavin-dependent oxidoreductase [Hansschlegelia quercus]|uniref:LLM class flavin-dependent oxidoreductase n=1 Tax=Hansschlegelia quercus TaxID=2528245 RepID=A0A4Q9GFW4_9HYPH|nr:LLM class flavin-dependent oxidoreductase [Hansschlegelia quercus]TBN51760.1 LLM class flavin-dependent oxidoreductase [Hansschlegelia quercus]